MTRWAHEEILLWLTIFIKATQMKNPWTVFTLQDWATQVTLEAVPVMISLVHDVRIYNNTKKIMEIQIEMRYVDNFQIFLHKIKNQYLATSKLESPLPLF